MQKYLGVLRWLALEMDAIRSSKIAMREHGHVIVKFALSVPFGTCLYDTPVDSSDVNISSTSFSFYTGEKFYA